MGTSQGASRDGGSSTATRDTQCWGREEGNSRAGVYGQHLHHTAAQGAMGKSL